MVSFTMLAEKAALNYFSNNFVKPCLILLSFGTHVL